MFKQFPTVHCHPASVVDSASTPAQFVKREVELGTGYVTATDHGSLAGAKEIFDLGKKAGLTPIIGLEAYLRDDNCPILLKNGIPQSKEMVCGRCHEKWKNETTPDCSCGASSGVEKKHFWDYLKYMHLTMHFRDYPAYLTGVRLLTKADLNGERHGSERKPIFTWEDIEELAAQNVTMTSSCLIGVVQRHLVAHSNMDIAFQYFDKFHSMCGDRFYAEVFPHKTDKNWTQGVRITTEDGTKHRYYFGKKVLTNKSEIQVSSLASDWLKNNHGGHIEITAIKHNRTWEQISPPWKIKDVELLEGFTPNECTFWSSDGDHQKGCNEFIIELAKSYNIPVVIGDDSHYANKEDKIVQDIKLAQSGNWRFYGHYHRQSSQEAYEHFNSTLGTSTSEFERWVDNSLAWAEGFKGFNFESKPRLPLGFYPGDSLERTIALIEKHGRMQWDNPVYVNRLYYELELMHSNGKIDLLPYFFPLEEVCNSYSERGELTGPGRGSAAGTLLTYLLEITHADPIKYKLSIDRFITMDRIKSGALPDIDQDLPDREALTSRGGWLEKRFGDCFAQISVDTKMKLKSAVKDVHRALYGYVAPDVEAFTKRFGAVPQGVDDHEHVFGHTANGTWVPGAIETDIALKEYVEKYPKEWGIVQQCLGLCRNKGRHACAFIIADEAISNFIPLTEVGGERVTQFTAKSVESVGGIKYDLLTINSLQDISTAIQIIQSRSNLSFDETVIDNKKVPKHRLIPRNGKLEDIWNLPEDQDVFDDIADGKTESVFQFNTAGARQWMVHFNHNRPDGKPIVRSVYDLSVFTALDRPGPLDVFVINPEDDTKHNALVEYARRARGLTPSPEIPEVIASLLPETYGIMVFQEQLQYAYQMLMNCSGAEAEEFRRAVAKKDASKIQKKYEPFIERAALKVGSREAAKSVWDFFSSWSSYGFNCSIDAATILPVWQNKPKTIAEFQPGDLIPAVDDLGNTIVVKVLALHDHGELEGIEVTFDDGYQVIVTENHKFLTEKGQVPISQIISDGLEVFCEPNFSMRYRSSLETIPSTQSSVYSVSGNMCGTATAAFAETEWQNGNRDDLWCIHSQKDHCSTQNYVRCLRGTKKGEYPRQDGQTQHTTGTESGSIQSGTQDIGTSGYTTTESGKAERVEGFSSRRISENNGSRTESGWQAFQKRGGVEEDIWMAECSSSLRNGTETGGFCVARQQNMDRSGRVLALFRSQEYQGSAPKSQDRQATHCAVTGCNAKCRSSQKGGDVSSTGGCLLLDFQRSSKGRMYGVAYSDAPITDSRGLLRRRVIRYRSVGIRRMYDLEVDHPKHNFLLPNGIVTSNSHSVCYALIGYACAYLKHHFPLEWWCAVLRHAKKEEIAETFWAHAGHLIDLPDIRYSGENFEIHGKRIRAPFSLVDGVGPTAHQQLLDGRPYTSLDDFVAKAKSKGRALHSGICYKLIVTGILNPLFKSDNIFDRLAEYEQAVANYLNSKEQPIEVLPSGKIKKKTVKKPESIDSRYANLTATERYQLIKQVMPVYSEDIRKLVVGTHLHKTANGKWYLRAPEEASFSEEIIEVLDRRGFEEAEVKPFRKPVRIALVAYVQSVREFSPKNNRAWELILDMAGGLRQTVYWGYGNSNPEELVEGAILGFILKKSKPDRDFSVECWRVLAKHLKDIEELPKPPTVWSHKYETPSGAVDIQRGSKWGNPYSHLANSTAIYKTKTVEEAVKSYESWIMTQPSMLASLKELKGKHLVCACPPKKGLGPTDDGGYRCHGQILLRMAAAV